MSDDPPQASPENPLPADPAIEPAVPDPNATAPLADAPPADVAASDVAAAAGAASIEPVPEAVAADASVDAASSEAAIDQATIDELLKQAAFEDPTATVGAMADDANAAAAAPVPAGEPFELPNFNQVMADAQISSIDLLRDVELNVKIELGRSRMLVEDVLKLGEGSVVELDKLAGDPVDVFVNDRLVARGEVLVLNENFCVRVNEIIAGIKDEGQ